MPISLKTAIKSSYGDKKSKQKILNEGYVLKFHDICNVI